MIFLLLIALANGQTSWTRTCGDCRWEVSAGKVLQRVSGSPETCECFSVDFSPKSPNNSPGHMYTSIADEAFKGVTITSGLTINNDKNDKWPLQAMTDKTFSGLHFASSGSWTARLDINMNSLSTVPVEAFTGITGEWELQIGYNPMKDCNFKLGTAIEIEMSNTNLLAPCAYPMFLGTGGELKTLDMGVDDDGDYNTGTPSWGVLDVDTFDTMPKLEIIKMKAMGITHLPVGIFSHTPNLNYLHFSDNKIKAIPAALIAGQNIEDFYFDNNEITYIEAGTFSGMNIDEINLSGNKLENVDGLLDGATSSYMDYIYLDNNKLVKLYDGMLDHLTSTYQIDVQYNQLRTLPANFFPNGFYTDYFTAHDNLFTGEGLSESWGGASGTAEMWPDFEDNPMTCLPENGVNVDPSYPDDVTTACPAADACTTACTGNYRRKSDANPSACSGTCTPNGSECCERSPDCECKDTWFTDEGKQREGCSAIPRGEAGAWCMVKDAPCKTLKLYYDELGPEDYEYWHNCEGTSACLMMGWKSRGKHLKTEIVSDIAACHQLCQDTPNCMVWQWNMNKKECKLRDVGKDGGYFRLAYSYLYTSGMANCNPFYED